MKEYKIHYTPLTNQKPVHVTGYRNYNNQIYLSIIINNIEHQYISIYTKKDEIICDMYTNYQPALNVTHFLKTPYKITIDNVYIYIWITNNKEKNTFLKYRYKTHTPKDVTKILI